MKKNLLIAASITLFIVALVLSSHWQEKRIIDKSEQWYEGNEIIMTIKEGTLTKTKATIIIKDTKKEKNSYGMDFRIEKKENGLWRILEPNKDNYGFHSMAYYVDENNELELVQNWEYIYGELEQGHYRLVKYFLPITERPVTKKDQVYFAAEFTIE